MIDQAIDALNDGVERAETAAESAESAAETTGQNVIAANEAKEAAQTAQTAAETAQAEAEEAQEAAETAQSNAQSYADNAAGSAQTATAKASEAAQSAADAEQAAEDAQTAQSSAEAAQRASETAKDQAMQAVANVQETVDAALQEAKDSGEFDGPQGPKGEPGIQGEPGEQGVQGIQGVKGDKGDKGDTGATGPKGDTGATGPKGDTGAQGIPGVSPSITVTDITGGHRVTITDATGAHSFDVMDGDVADAPVQDVQVNGTSVLSDGVANVPVASSSVPGVMAIDPDSSPFTIWHHPGKNIDILMFNSANSQIIKDGVNPTKVSAVNRQHEAAFYGLAKAAGDATQSESSNAVGVYTDEAKIAIQKMLGVYREWELIADVTVSEDSQIFNVDTDINGQPFELSNMLVRAWLQPSTTGVNDYIGSANLTITTDGVDTNTHGTTQRYLANGASTFFEYKSEIICGVTLTRGRAASVPNSSQSVSEISSSTTNTKSFRGFRLSRYSESTTLIPAGSNIKIYGIRM